MYSELRKPTRDLHARQFCGVGADLLTRPTLSIAVYYSDMEVASKTIVSLEDGMPAGFAELIDGFLERAQKRHPDITLTYIPPLNDAGVAQDCISVFHVSNANKDNMLPAFEQSVARHFKRAASFADPHSVIPNDPLRNDGWFSALAEQLPDLFPKQK